MGTPRLSPPQGTKTGVLSLTQGAANLDIRAIRYETRRKLPPRVYQTPSPHQPLRSRASAPTIAALKQMRRDFGRLVFVRMRLPTLDHVSIVTGAGRRQLVAAAKRLVYGWASVYAKGLQSRKLICCIHRDEFGNTHLHLAIPLMAVSKRFRTLIVAAPHGEDGGVELVPDLHAVLIEDTDKDVERVGGYLCRPVQALPQYQHDQAALFERLGAEMDEDNGERVALIWHSDSRWCPGFKSWR